MKEITIPNDTQPFVVTINDLSYTYTPGETVQVPDDVYEIIIQQINSAPVYDTTRKLETVEYKPEDAGKMSRIKDDGSGIEWTDIVNVPAPSAANVGKTLVAKQTGWKKGDVIIPEQEVEGAGDQFVSLVNTNDNLFTVGKNVILDGTYDGELTGEFYEESFHTLESFYGDAGLFYNMSDEDLTWSAELVICPRDGEECLGIGYNQYSEGAPLIKKVALYVAEPVYEWVEDPGLPTPIESDLGKSLMVKQTGWKKGSVIAPLQNVTIDNHLECTLSNTHAAIFTPGTNVVVSCVFEGEDEDPVRFEVTRDVLHSNNSGGYNYIELPDFDNKLPGTRITTYHANGGLKVVQSSGMSSYNITSISIYVNEGPVCEWVPGSAEKYDLVIEGRNWDDELSNFTVIGDLLNCESIIDDGGTINAVCVIHEDWSYKPSAANSNKKITVLPLVLWNCPYTTIKFGSISADGTYHMPAFNTAEFEYDPSDGSIISVYTSIIFLATD